jgi:hypothetical protein
MRKVKKIEIIKEEDVSPLRTQRTLRFGLGKSR